MEKSTRIRHIISAILFGLAALYLAGGVMLRSVGLEYRFRVSVLGKCLCVMALPFWVGCLGFRKLRQRFRENTAVRLLGGILTAIYLAWCPLAALAVLFTTYEDNSLGGGLVAVVVESFPRLVSYAVYESVGPFFRRKTSLTPEVLADYLTAKYKREFYPMEEEGEIFYIDAEREVIKVQVEFSGGELHDGYPQALADYYLQEGCQALGLKWDSCLIAAKPGEEHFCLVLDEEKNDLVFGEDVYRLMQYALEKEPVLEKYDVFIYLSYEGKWGRVGFGRTRQWRNLSSREYKDDEAKVAQSVRWSVDSMRIRAHMGRLLITDIQETALGCAAIGGFPGNAGEVRSDTVSVPEPTPRPTEREMAEAEYPKQCEAAEAIWEAELKSLGYELEPGLNAKGNLVIWLGKLPADNLQSTGQESDYYLTYDRESKNGNCYLFVLSEVPEGNYIYDAYLREFYACEKGTLKVAAGDKTSWSQVACEEYRELTGE